MFVPLGNQTQVLVHDRESICHWTTSISDRDSLSFSFELHFLSLLSSLCPLSIVYVIVLFTAECKSIYLPLLFRSSGQPHFCQWILSVWMQLGIWGQQERKEESHWKVVLKINQFAQLQPRGPVLYRGEAWLKKCSEDAISQQRSLSHSDPASFCKPQDWEIILCCNPSNNRWKDL